MAPINIPLWKQAPFLRLLPPLIAGIILGWLFPWAPVFYPLPAVAIFIAVCLILYFLLTLLGGRLRKYSGGGVLFSLFLLGALLTWWNKDSLRPDFAGPLLTDSSFLKVRLVSPLEEKPHSWKAEAKIESVLNGDTVQNARGKAFLYFQKEQQKPILKYGETLLIPNRLEEIKPSNNPGAFDYSRYCELKNIYFSAYLPAGSWLLLKEPPKRSITAFFLNCRAICLSVLEQYIKPSRELGVAEALLLGYRGNLDPELYQAYANVGVVHLIAISGLHVGLIYLILIGLLRFLPDREAFRIIKGALVCIFLWGFTLLTGAHPSTLRAAIMLSFLVAGKFFFKREANTYNSLAASAFLLLCFNPYLLFDVGFQLSYLAVAGILIFQKPFNKLLWFKSRAGNYIWEMLSISLAAQLLTFPLVLYYFHQFPSFFLVSNLLLIPAATLALYGEVLLLAFSFIPAFAKLLGMGLSGLLGFMNRSILWANQFQFIRFQHIRLHPMELLLLYGFIILLFIWIFHKRKKALVGALAIIAVGSLFSLMQKWENHTQKKLIVYQTAGYSTIEMINGQQSQILGNASGLDNKNIQRYTLMPAKEVFHIKSRTIRQGNLPFFKFHNKKIGLIQKYFHPDSLRSFFPLDYVILSRYNRLKIKDIQRHFSPHMIVFDASVSPWQKQKWKTACKKLNLHCFSVPDQGAWILSLK